MIPDNFPVMSPVLQISVSYCRDHIVWFVALSTCYLAKKTVNNILAKHLLIVKQASVQQNVEVFTLCMYGIYLFMNSAEPKNAMLLSTDMPGVFQPMSSSQSPPPPPPPWHLSSLNTGLFVCRGKSNTLSCPTSALPRTLMSELLHIGSLAWRIAGGAPAPWAPAPSHEMQTLSSKQELYS